MPISVTPGRFMPISVTEYVIDHEHKQQKPPLTELEARRLPVATKGLKGGGEVFEGLFHMTPIPHKAPLHAIKLLYCSVLIHIL